VTTSWVSFTAAKTASGSADRTFSAPSTKPYSAVQAGSGLVGPTRCLRRPRILLVVPAQRRPYGRPTDSRSAREWRCLRDRPVGPAEGFYSFGRVLRATCRRRWRDVRVPTVRRRTGLPGAGPATGFLHASDRSWCVEPMPGDCRFGCWRGGSLRADDRCAEP
jgi:hypothetical protein